MSFRLRPPSRPTPGAFRSLVLALGLVLAACDSADGQPPAPGAYPDAVAFTADELYPEGLAYDPTRDAVLVGSMTRGAVGLVRRDGRYEPLLDDALLVSSTGLLVDTERGRLYVCVADPGTAARTRPETQGRLARLVAFDLASGRRIATYDLGALADAQPGTPGGHFANGAALDDDGNVYVTDSFGPYVYRVTPDGAATVLVTDTAFTGEGFNLNGVVAHPDGYLLVAKYNEGALFRLTPAGATARVERVSLEGAPEGGYGAADGLALGPDGALYLVQNGAANAVHRLESADGWRTARRTGSFTGAAAGDPAALAFPTSAAFVGDALHVVDARLGELFTAGAPRSSTFSVVRARF